MDNKQKIKQLDILCKKLDKVHNKIYHLEAQYPTFDGETNKNNDEYNNYIIEQLGKLRSKESKILKKIYNLAGWKI